MEEQSPRQTPAADGSPAVDQRLKHLEFFRVAAIQALACFSSLYGFAKDSSGPLKPGVQAVEGTVKSVVGPVYDRLHDIPYEILKFVDQKVDDTVHELDRRVPSLVKSVSSRAYMAAQKAPEVAKSIAGGVQRDGVVPTAAALAKDAAAKCEPAAKRLYAAYEPVAEQYAVSAWQTLNRLPLFPQAAQVVFPTLAHWTEKYNSSVSFAAVKGYSVAAYLPHIPTERISKVFNGGGKTAAASG